VTNAGERRPGYEVSVSLFTDWDSFLVGKGNTQGIHSFYNDCNVGPRGNVNEAWNEQVSLD